MIRRLPGLLICGLPRSGTTLMRALLGSHPALALPQAEMNFWVRAYPRHRLTRQGSAWRTFIDALLDDDATRSLELDRRAVRQVLLEEVPVGAHAEAFAVLMSYWAAGSGRAQWGEKTPLAEFHAEAALRELPELRVIHVMRDPRDTLASHRHLPWPKPSRLSGRITVPLRGSVAWIAGNWRDSVHVGERLATGFPGRYLPVRYEAVVSDPEGEMRRICAFLKLPFALSMLEMAGDPTMTAGGNSSFVQHDRVGTSSVGRFATVLSPRDIRLCEVMVGGAFGRRGYVPFDGAVEPVSALADRAGALLIDLTRKTLLRATGIPRA